MENTKKDYFMNKFRIETMIEILKNDENLYAAARLNFNYFADIHKDINLVRYINGEINNIDKSYNLNKLQNKLQELKREA